MGGDNHGDDREDATQSTMTNGQSTIMLPHQDDSNLLQLDSNSNQSLCESYQRQSTFNSNLGAAGHSRSLKRSSSQISDYPSNSEVLRLGQTPTERIGSLNVRSEEDMEEDHTRLAYYNNVTALERPVSVTSPRLLVQPGTSHPRSHLRDILNQDSCPASYEQKRFRSNSIDSTKSCRTTTGVIPSHLYHPADVFCNSRSAEEVYKFKNNIKERFRADVLHHNNFDDPNQPSNQDGMVAPAHDSYPKMPTSESFGISRMFPSTNGTQNERSFATLNGFGSFSVDNELAIKNQTETTPSNETMRPDIVTIRNGNPSSRSSSCGSNPSPHSLSSNCFTNQAGSSNNNKYNTSSADGNKNGSSSGLSSTSGYSTSGEGSSTISVRHKTTRKSSYSSGSPSSSRNNNGENSLINSSVEASNSLIPVFALHPKGTFYVPLTLDSSLLAPHLGDRQYLTDPEERLTLHPVNISVSFFHGRSNCKNRNEGTLMPPWKTKREPETSYDSYRERVY